MSDEPRTDQANLREASVYARIYAITARIPAGKLASNGQIAAIEGRCTPRMVGYAMAAAGGRPIPWQRVINSHGAISERRRGGGSGRQRRLLEREGIVFDSRGRVDFEVYGWSGPDWEWLEQNGFYSAPAPGARARRRP